MVVILFLNNLRTMKVPKEKVHEPPESALKIGEEIEVNEQKRHSAFLCAEHLYFHYRHLFSCVDSLLLCYKVLNMGRVALF